MRTFEADLHSAMTHPLCTTQLRRAIAQPRRQTIAEANKRDEDTKVTSSLSKQIEAKALMAVLTANTTRTHTHTEAPFSLQSSTTNTVRKATPATRVATAHLSTKSDGEPKQARNPRGARAALPSAIPPVYSGPRARSEARVRESEVLTAGTGRRKRGKEGKQFHFGLMKRGKVNSHFAVRCCIT